jgi:hypothetical protein
MRLLALVAAPTAALVVALATAPSAGVATAVLALLGLCGAPLFPIAKATAYRALPEDSAAVNAVESAFAPLGMALPLVVAGVATLDLRAAVLVLAVQPLVLLALALTALRRSCADPPR